MDFRAFVGKMIIRLKVFSSRLNADVLLRFPKDARSLLLDPNSPHCTDKMPHQTGEREPSRQQLVNLPRPALCVRVDFPAVLFVLWIMCRAAATVAVKDKNAWLMSVGLSWCLWIYSPPEALCISAARAIQQTHAAHRSILSSSHLAVVNLPDIFESEDVSSGPRFLKGLFLRSESGWGAGLRHVLPQWQPQYKRVWCVQLLSRSGGQK